MSLLLLHPKPQWSIMETIIRSTDESIHNHNHGLIYRSFDLLGLDGKSWNSNILDLCIRDKRGYRIRNSKVGMMWEGRAIFLRDEIVYDMGQKFKWEDWKKDKRLEWDEDHEFLLGSKKTVRHPILIAYNKRHVQYLFQG